MTNSTTLEGWLKKTNFSKLGDDPIQALVRLKAARMHPMNYMTTGIREYIQWFRGEDNVVTNSLSRDGDWLDEELTQLFCTHCPSQIPPYFKIQPLPSKITSWLTVLLLKLPVKAHAVQKKTHKDQSWLWNRWTEACGWIGLLNPFLDNIPRPLNVQTCWHLCCGYMHKARFSGPSYYDQLAHGSVTSGHLACM
jgi:hypothetical protein